MGLKSEEGEADEMKCEWEISVAPSTSTAEEREESL